VQPELLPIPHGRLTDVLEPAGNEQPSSEEPEPTLPLKLPEVGCHHASRREPGQRHAPVLGRAEIHPSIAEYVEGEAAASLKPKGSHPMCQTLLEDERLDASNLLQSSDPLL
jgi:hypothetical protein